jgi:hypothetical protein
METPQDLSRSVEVSPIPSPSLSAIRPLLPPGKVHLIPVEILSEIFVLASQHWLWCRNQLMLVCQYWRAILLSTPGVASRLRIRRATQKEVVQAFTCGRTWHLDVTIDIKDEKDGKDFNAADFHACLMAAAQAASRWCSLELISPPPSGEYKGLQILQPLQRLKSFKLALGFGSLFEPLLTAISKTAAHLTVMELADPDAVLYLLRPPCFHIFSFLTTLKIQLSRRMEGPADILPHLQRLETFEAYHLHLPAYLSDAPFPLIQTLKDMSLKSVSIQWMGGQTFPALQRCSIIFPHDADTIQPFQPITMLSCFFLKYYSNNLSPLNHFYLPSLHTLGVKNGQWSVWRGNIELVNLHPIFVANAQRLTFLQLHIHCSEKLLIEMLRVVPALRMLWLGLASPLALSEAFFLEFVAGESNASSPHEMVGLPSHNTTASFCTPLELLHLHYKRWVRGPERKAIIPAFIDIVASKCLKEDFNLTLSFDEMPEQHWGAAGPIKIVHESWKNDLITIEISNLHATISLWTKSLDSDIFLPFQEAQSLHVGGGRLSIDLLFTLHHLVELRIAEKCSFIEPPPPPHNLPLLYTLRVLDATIIPFSLLAGQTFHKLKRCRVGLYGEGHHLSQGLFTEMPLCTRMDVDSLTLLASFKLPQLCELGVPFDHPESTMIWEKHIKANVNLLGLRLLHVKQWTKEVDLIQILIFLPVLKSLIIRNDRSRLGVDFFRAFVPMDKHRASESSGGHQIWEALCPVLESVQIEGVNLEEELELIPVLKEVVTLRAVIRSPLKSFTFSHFWPEPKKKWKLIRWDGSFAVKQVKAKDALEFKLDI